MTIFKEALIEKKIKIKSLKKIRIGETSKTYIGEYKNQKVIVKYFLQNKLNKVTNHFLKNKIRSQIIVKKLFPKILYANQKDGLLIYKFFKESAYKKNRVNYINNIGIKLKELHSIKLPKNILSIDDQLTFYKKILTKNSNLLVLNELQEFFKLIKRSDSKYVFSHNDLNSANILYSDDDDVCFIDYEYASLNSRYCDLSKIIENLSLNKSEINALFNGYGLKISKNTHNSIRNWVIMNNYIELIWLCAFNEIKKNYFKTSHIKRLLDKIKRLKQ